MDKQPVVHEQYEQELAGYLQERIKPGLNRGAIPLLARSIARDLAQRDRPGAEADGDGDGDGGAVAEVEDSGGPLDFEAEMRDFQAELGEDWILRFSVHGEDAWLTAEKDDGSQRIEAPTAAVISDAVALLDEGGRS